MADTRQVANIFRYLDKYLSTTQQVLSFFRAVLHYSPIEHFNSAGLIFQSK